MSGKLKLELALSVRKLCDRDLFLLLGYARATCAECCDNPKDCDLFTILDRLFPADKYPEVRSKNDHCVFY